MMRTCWEGKNGCEVVLLGLDYNYLGTLESSYVDHAGVAWGVMGPDTVMWPNDDRCGPISDGDSLVEPVGRMEVPQTDLKSIALATDRWPTWPKHKGRGVASRV